MNRRALLGLAMIVKDEARNMAACLAPLLPLLDEVSIVDTGSTDGTPDLLRREFGIEAVGARLDPDECFDKTPARNLALAGLATDWVLVVDADERVAPEALGCIRERLADASWDGYFCPWITHRDGQRLEDYKLALFRNGLRARGRVHENMQTDLRARGGRAAWCADLVIDHHPDPGRGIAKRQWYLRRLECALGREPEWIRYHWFRGYIAHREGDARMAEAMLGAAAGSRSRRFPVECLNAHLVLAEIHAGRRDATAALRTLDSAREFLATVREDWEVRINFRLGPWLETAAGAVRAGRFEDVRCYEFAC